MEQIVGTSNKVLEVDLSSRSSTTVTVSETDRRQYLGAKGLALKLLYDRLTPGIDPLGDENIIAFMMGVYMGTGAPCSGRFAAATRSPLTGIITTASCGGPFGMALKTSGWDGLLIKGKAEKPTYLVIDRDGVAFKDGSALWGQDTQETQAAVSGEGRSALCIGPAGENRVRFANVCSGHRYLGRGGMGAVFGAKNLKAIVAKGGEFKIVARDAERFRALIKKANGYIQSNEFTSGLYRDYGTSSSVSIYNALGMLPVKNFSKGAHDETNKLSGQHMAKVLNSRHKTCTPCQIRCGHIGTVDGKERIVPEYETVGLMGMSLMVFDPLQVAEWNETCGRMGMDTISAGGTLAWAMEATEKGIFRSDLRFGEAAGVSAALDDIAQGRGLGRELALGSRALSDKYGGKEYAMQVKGLELPAYDPRATFGMGLNYAVANRGGCHLSTTIMAQESKLQLLDPYTTKGKAHHVRFLENLYCGINSMQTCHFTAYAYQMEVPLIKYTYRPIIKFLVQHLYPIALRVQDVDLWPAIWSAITGIPLSRGAFLKAGERIHVLERYMNTREGISRKDDALPERLLTEGRECDPKKRTVPLHEMLDVYYKIRGYDANGIPTDATLQRLGIDKRPAAASPGA